MESPEIENLVLANHVEAVNGLLYISGGGWTDHWRPQQVPGAPPMVSHLGVAVTVLIPASAPPIPQQLAVAVEDERGQQIAGMQTQLGQARPPGIPPGDAQRVVLALSFNLVFPGPGAYRLVARLGISAPRELPFRVHDVSPPAASPPIN